MAFPGAAQAAPVSYTGGAYLQNFDTLPTTGSGTLTGKGPNDLVPGWVGATGLTGWQGAIDPTSSGTNTEYRAQDGSLSGSAGRGLISFGTTAATDRALGALATSNQIPSFGLLLTNTSSLTFTEFTLSYTGEQWRRGNVPSPNKLAFAYGEGANINSPLTAFAGLNFTAPNTQVSPTEVALDGNAKANQTAISATITGLNWAPGETLVLRWAGEDLSGQDDGLGIDNLSFTAHVVPEPSSVALALLGGMGVLAAMWRRRAARA
ncbi:MAG: PEP-CTERM sorting domain-containing protein [Pirellulales bacterium]